MKQRATAAPQETSTPAERLLLFAHRSGAQKREFKRRYSSRENFMRGFVQVQQRRFEPAIADFEAALALYPTHGPMRRLLKANYGFLARKHAREGDRRRALRYLRKFQRLETKTPPREIHL